MTADYRSAGVDRDAAGSFIDHLKAEVKKTHRPEVLSELGDYGGFFVAPSRYKEPVFVASTDGVGTKILLAEEAGAQSFEGIGQDAVAMCVNDLLCCRAEPLVFLDYLALDSLSSSSLPFLMKGVVGACQQSGCSLLGGETAQMPGFYKPGRLDIAGFSIGVVERSKRFQKQSVQAGDQIFGLPSSGFHSNGYSLIRKIMKEQSWNLDSKVEGEVLGEALLRPTTLYVKSLLKLWEEVEVKAVAHITGGGVVENLPRVFEEEQLQAVLDLKAFSPPRFVTKITELSGLSLIEKYSTWNMGIGICVIASASQAELIRSGAFGSWKVLGEMRAKRNSSDPSVLLQGES